MAVLKQTIELLPKADNRALQTVTAMVEVMKEERIKAKEVEVGAFKALESARMSEDQMRNTNFYRMYLDTIKSVYSGSAADFDKHFMQKKKELDTFITQYPEMAEKLIRSGEEALKSRLGEPGGAASSGKTLGLVITDYMEKNLGSTGKFLGTQLSSVGNLAKGLIIPFLTLQGAVRVYQGVLRDQAEATEIIARRGMRLGESDEEFARATIFINNMIRELQEEFPAYSRHIGTVFKDFATSFPSASDLQLNTMVESAAHAAIELGDSITNVAQDMIKVSKETRTMSPDQVALKMRALRDYGTLLSTQYGKGAIDLEKLRKNTIELLSQTKVFGVTFDEAATYAGLFSRELESGRLNMADLVESLTGGPTRGREGALAEAGMRILRDFGGTGEYNAVVEILEAIDQISDVGEKGATMAYAVRALREGSKTGAAALEEQLGLTGLVANTVELRKQMDAAMKASLKKVRETYGGGGVGFEIMTGIATSEGIVTEDDTMDQKLAKIGGSKVVGGVPDFGTFASKRMPQLQENDANLAEASAESISVTKRAIEAITNFFKRRVEAARFEAKGIDVPPSAWDKWAEHVGDQTFEYIAQVPGMEIQATLLSSYITSYLGFLGGVTELITAGGRAISESELNLALKGAFIPGAQTSSSHQIDLINTPEDATDKRLAEEAQMSAEQQKLKKGTSGYGVR